MLSSCYIHHLRSVPVGLGSHASISLCGVSRSVQSTKQSATLKTGMPEPRAEVLERQPDNWIEKALGHRLFVSDVDAESCRHDRCNSQAIWPRSLRLCLSTTHAIKPVGRRLFLHPRAPRIQSTHLCIALFQGTFQEAPGHSNVPHTRP